VASLDGRSEIGMAAIAITLSDVVVFAPIAFMSGIVGQYFKQFGLVVVCATLFSLLVSFTVTPMMASRLFKEGHSKAKRFQGFYTFMDNFEENLKELYGKILLVCLRNRIKVALIFLVLLAISVSFLFTGRIGMEFMPYTDSGEFTINLSLDPGATIESTDEKTKQVEEYIKTLKEREYYYSRVGSVSEPNKSSIFVKLVDKKKKKKQVTKGYCYFYA
jgi:HAE1 family hydrophobic/amphiphilic exporter-1